jgi:hypothetical protein
VDYSHGVIMSSWNRVLRRILGPKRDSDRKMEKTMHNEEFYNLFNIK